ncbi:MULTISPECIES: methylated-DNA--[protein]-cysteine S-methyltransferase [Proteus]|uniref:methylated-DNA--[protein]-cysteine S-methyltransferase n=1 Tax=Proteus TaxID=583 RepID=UPI000D6965ED|nr:MULTISPECIES: methylated-DNA--[protein]-cysteine S-methyltransferase [Proteus]MBG5950390.1 methylated-DNA--[protein]-cysteine S-methyltransferase [Proteus terrae]MCE9839529.1 methylated-DNA--[protein]-cysteine S-methyltransferase [Proteus terrae]MCT8264805.1 methylated-DNA--[protein]-cysteine S-methyltransferase [Proteus terrae]NBN72359.1 methylated-DNA--[protein]-cysteine S-methyltransferase [Proteus sp. G2618]
MYQDYLDAPKGFPKPYISITANEKGITSLYFVNDKEVAVNSSPVINQCIKQLKEYFAGKRTTFSVPLAPEGTEFQSRVWNTLQTIPYGEIWSYKKLALTLGSVNYCRAVGMANSRNPISLIIPCHRVIGHNGKLVGYTGGLDIKRWLLQYEKVEVDE